MLRGKDWIEYCKNHVRENMTEVVEAILNMSNKYRLDLSPDFGGAVYDIENDELLQHFDATDLVAVLGKYRNASR